jgi:DNA-binding protein H-NS
LAAKSFEKIEDSRNKQYEQISTSLKEIAASFKTIAEAKKKKVSLLERLVAVKEMKYGIVRPEKS